MVKRFVMFVLAVGLSAPVSAQDARAVLQASLKAMGGENLKTIQYSGAGWSSATLPKSGEPGCRQRSLIRFRWEPRRARGVSIGPAATR